MNERGVDIILSLSRTDQLGQLGRTRTEGLTGTGRSIHLRQLTSCSQLTSVVLTSLSLHRWRICHQGGQGG